LANTVMLEYETDVAAAVMDPTNFTVADAVVNWTEANIATFDPAQDINVALEALTLIGEMPNTIIMALAVFNRMKRAKLLQTYLYGFLNATQGSANISPERPRLALWRNSLWKLTSKSSSKRFRPPVAA